MFPLKIECVFFENKFTENVFPLLMGRYSMLLNFSTGEKCIVLDYVHIYDSIKSTLRDTLPN